jgi:transposase
MIDVTELMGTVFSGLSALVIVDAEDAGEVICVRARTRSGAVACPGCGTETGRVHGYHERTAADVPADGRRVVLKVRARRMRCPVTGCGVQTFREQVPGVLDRYQRRTTRLTAQVSAVARELAGCFMTIWWRRASGSPTRSAAAVIPRAAGSAAGGGCCPG